MPTSRATASIRNNNLGHQPMRVEMRLFGVNWAATTNFTPIVQVGGMNIAHLGGTSNPAVLFVGGPDTMSPVGPNPPVITGDTDILIRLTRDIASALFTIEIYDTQTGTQLATSNAAITALASSSTIQGNNITIGGPNATGNIGFLRWYSTIVPIGTAIPVGTSTPADLGDWEFGNTENDTSGVRGNQNFDTITSFVNTPIYSPVCNAGVAQTVTVGSTLILNGSNSYPLDGSASLSYSWSVLSGTATLSATNVAAPSATNLTGFGTQSFQLTVRDSSGDSSTCSIKHGVVFADANGVINLTAEGLDATSQKFIGPLIMYGQNFWPWADTAQLTTLTRQMSNLATYYTPYWRNTLPGTVSVTGGSATITGTGTDLTAPCGGGSSPLQNAVLILKYPGTDGLAHYTEWDVVSCNSTTSLTIAAPYPTAPITPWPTCATGCSGLSWNWGYVDAATPPTYSPQFQWGVWTYNVAPGNYYDNAKSFYSMYWRTGIDTYLTAFQNLADIWWEFPKMDQGYGCYSGFNTSQNNPTCWAPGAWRSMALTGVVLRALEEGPSSTKWAGLRVVWQLAQYNIGVQLPNSAPSGIDFRESGYEMAALAYCSLADPDPSWQASCQATIKGTLGLSTTSSAAIGFGTQTVTPASMAGITAGLVLVIDPTSIAQEPVTVVSTTGTTFNAVFANSHPAGVGITAGVWTPNRHAELGNSWGAFYANGLYETSGATSIGHINGGFTNMSACATNGSTVVTGINTTWVSGMNTGAANGGPIWFFTPISPATPSTQPPTNGVNASTIGDPRYYDFTVNNNTLLTLTTPYQGATGCGKGFVIGFPQGSEGFVGWGIQPWMMGHLAQAFFLAAAAMERVDTPSFHLFQQYGDAAVQTITNNGINPDLGGLYNGIFLVGCNTFPIAPSNIPCYPAFPNDSRILSLELPRAFAEDYLAFRNPSVKVTMDLIMSQMFSKPGTGGPTNDPGYLSEFDPGQIDVTGIPPIGTAPKWTGQLCGYTEGCDMWPAVRFVGTTRTPRTVKGAVKATGRGVVK